MSQNVRLKGRIVAEKHNQIVVNIMDEEAESYIYEEGAEVEIEFLEGIEKFEDDED